MLEVKARQEAVLRELTSGSAQIKRYISRRAADADDLADIYQESITRVLEQSRRSRIENPIAYAIKVARNLIISKPDAVTGIDEEISCPRPSPEDNAAHTQRVERLTHFLQSMPPLRREVFMRRRIHGESRSAIARALEISEEAAKKHITRALADLQRYLDEGAQ